MNISEIVENTMIPWSKEAPREERTEPHTAKVIIHNVEPGDQITCHFRGMGYAHVQTSITVFPGITDNVAHVAMIPDRSFKP